MKRKGLQIIIVIIMALILFVGMEHWIYAGKDVSGLIESKMKIELWQDGKLIDPDKPVLDQAKSFQMKMLFSIPVEGDPGESHWVERGDFANIKLADIVPQNLIKSVQQTFKSVQAKPIQGKTYTVGDVFVGDDDNGRLMVLLAFSGDAELYRTAQKVEMEVKMDFSLKEELIKDKQTEKTITILDKTYTFQETHQYQAEITVDLEDAKYLRQESTWIVNFEGKQLQGEGFEAEDLAGKWVEFRLTNPHLLAIDLNGVTLNDAPIEATSLNPITEMGKTVGFRYQLPDNSRGRQVLKVKSQIISLSPSYVSEEDIKVAANFKLYQTEANPLVTAYQEALLRGLLMLEKQALGIEGQEISWAVVVNHQAKELKQVTVIDPVGLDYEFVSAKLERADSSSGAEVWRETGQNWTTEPVGGIYQLGDINQKLRLVLRWKVKNNKPQHQNTASIAWQGETSTTVSASYYHWVPQTDIVSKAQDRDFPRSFSNVRWVITVSGEGLTNLTNPRLLDFFISDPSFYEAVQQGKFSEISVPSLSGIDLSEAFQLLLREKPLQKYQGNLQIDLSEEFGEEFLISHGDELLAQFKEKSHDVKLNGKKVGQILEITGPVGFGWKLEYQSQDLNEILVGHSKSLKNVAMLYSNNQLIEVETAYGLKLQRWLFKDVLTARQAEIFLKEMRPKNGGPVMDENHGPQPETGDTAFNYQDYSILYRLHLSNMGLDNLYDLVGKMTVIDQLPAGWEFDLVDGVHPFVAFHAWEPYTNPSSFYEDHLASMIPMGSILYQIKNMELQNPTQFKGANRAEFQIKGNLKSSYIIYLKARPTEQKMKEYLQGKPLYEGDKPYFEVKNQLIGRYPGGEIRRQNSSKIHIKVLQKELLPKEGELHWTIDYQPFTLKTSQPELWMVDTIPQGLELRMSADGKPTAAPNFGFYETKIDINGNISLGEAIPLVPGENIRYDKASRQLRIKLPQKDKSYRFSYITDITARQNMELRNIVELEASDFKVEPSIRRYLVLSADVSATYTLPTKPKPEKPKPDKPKPDKPKPDKPIPDKPNPQDEVPENEVPRSPSTKEEPENKIPNDELNENNIPRGNHLPNTAGFPVQVWMSLAALLIGAGKAIKSKR